MIKFNELIGFAEDLYEGLVFFDPYAYEMEWKCIFLRQENRVLRSLRLPLSSRRPLQDSTVSAVRQEDYGYSSWEPIGSA